MESIRKSPIALDISDVADTASAPLIELFGHKHGLTAREKEVVRLLLLFGLRNEDLSSTLYISTKTAKHHLASIMDKTSARSSRELQALFLTFTFQQLAAAHSA